MFKSKKWLLWSIVSVFLFLELYLYAYIPSPLKIGRVQPIKCSSLAANRFLEEDRFLPWWKKLPGVIILDSGKGDSVFSYKNMVFTVGKKIHEYENIHIEYNHNRFQSTLLIIPQTKDSVHLVWSSVLPNSLNPIERYKNYNQAIEMSHILDSILSQFRFSLESTRETYGLALHEISLVHDIFITSRITTDQFPDTKTIYKEIETLKHYALSNGAVQLDSPMLHIEKNSLQKFETMVGIPIDKKIPESSPIGLKAMPKGGKIIMGTVIGGYRKIDSGLKSIQTYMMDIERASPAIPFQVLKTNRIKNPDSNRWVTDLYYPVI